MRWCSRPAPPIFRPMCNLYTYKMSADEMRGLMSHYRLIGTTWIDRVRMQNTPVDDVYPNRKAPVVFEKGGERIVREDMLWGFPPFRAGAGYGTNFRTLKVNLWRAWLDREHRCVVPATA